jgi:ABC-type nitrate/sulfonate/bicarbonate transport system permease component
MAGPALLEVRKLGKRFAQRHGRAVGATIVGEFLVSTEGVGRYIEHARQVADTTGVFAGIVVAITLVLAINGLVNLIERWALSWRPVEREMEL